MERALRTVIALLALTASAALRAENQQGPITNAPITGVIEVPASFYGGHYTNGRELALSYDGNVIANLQDYRNRGGEGKLLDLTTNKVTVFYRPKAQAGIPDAKPYQVLLSYDGSVVAFPTHHGVVIKRMASEAVYVDFVRALQKWNSKIGGPWTGRFNEIAMNRYGTVLYASTRYELPGDRTERRAIIHIRLGSDDGKKGSETHTTSVPHSAHKGERCYPFSTLTASGSGANIAFKGAGPDGKGMHCWIGTNQHVLSDGLYLAPNSAMAGSNTMSFRGGPIIVGKPDPSGHGDAPYILYHRHENSAPITFYNWSKDGHHLDYCQPAKGAPRPEYTDGVFMSYDGDHIVYTSGNNYVWYDMLAKAHWLRVPGHEKERLRPTLNNFISATGHRLLLLAKPRSGAQPPKLLVVDIGGVTTAPPPGGTTDTPGGTTVTPGGATDTAKELASAQTAYDKAKRDYSLIIRARQTDTPQGRRAKIAYVRAENRLNVARKKHADAAKPPTGGSGNPDGHGDPGGAPPAVVQGPVKIGEPKEHKFKDKNGKWVERVWLLSDLGPFGAPKEKRVVRPMKITVRHTDCGQGFGVMLLDRKPELKAIFSAVGRFPAYHGAATIVLSDPQGVKLSSSARKVGRWENFAAAGLYASPYIDYSWSSKRKPAPVPGTHTVEFGKGIQGGKVHFLTVPLKLLGGSTPTPPPADDRDDKVTSGIRGCVTRTVARAGQPPTQIPVKGARIIVIPATAKFRFRAGENDLLECDRVVTEVYTDDQGNYFADVPDGDYRVFVWFPQHGPVDRTTKAPDRADFSLIPNPTSSTFHQTLTVKKKKKSDPTTPPEANPPEDDKGGKVTSGIRGRVTRPIARLGQLPTESPVKGARIIVVPAAPPFRFKAGENDLLECERVVAEVYT
ncbi:hypothetical protein HQ560_20370, partial [bacterium]|nr:hypothetical protein [bacterium]